MSISRTRSGSVDCGSRSDHHRGGCVPFSSRQPEYCVQGASNAAHDVVHLRWPRISYSWVLGVREYLPEGRLFGFEKNMRLVTPQQVEAGFVEVQGIQDELLRVRGKMKSRAAKDLYSKLLENASLKLAGIASRSQNGIGIDERRNTIIGTSVGTAQG